MDNELPEKKKKKFGKVEKVRRILFPVYHKFEQGITPQAPIGNQYFPSLGHILTDQFPFSIFLLPASLILKFFLCFLPPIQAKWNQSIFRRRALYSKINTIATIHD